MRTWSCDGCDDKCEVLTASSWNPTNCMFFSWQKPKWRETSKPEEHNAVRPSGSSSAKADSGGAT
jgi:hypothetical protein